MESFFLGLGSKAFHGRNVFKWIHKHGVTDFDAMTDISKRLRLQLQQVARIELPQQVYEQPATDGTRKWVLELGDGQRIETVLIPDDGRNTLCVSSQVGCALDCSFCSTARQGFNRNLTVAEIIGQVWVASRNLGSPPSNIVLMGMGEPLANFDAVITAMKIMQDDLAYMVSKYRVTISTSGIVPALKRLRGLCDVSLAVSLHAPDNELRDKLVPINRKYPLQELIPACREYVKGDKRRKVTWEYVMLDGINDSLQQAKALISLLEGTPSKVNLIPFNPFPGTDYRTSPPERVEAFRMRLKRSGIIATTRKTRGEDIDAACGQLVGKVRDRSNRELRMENLSNIKLGVS
ncbi:MAG: 23S rRNA (adenine(2503)-C(2))-methyltransferase [gamma proteobacterium symbiont of Ctena orbiculata]|uniref:Dual-specificity RNA methyltransferase RlmN n=1 Tax=Candidatus Thiodiazotropha taylori TaxID=2792791 RepID=A0A944M607_9GAMM|nr:23S rRNA (adenine(2503)-C(2))-methyltransferase RlmN [Candidatus Thiodiazotropha taylori]PVV10659.1 MAG: 23S rRNA (adenine(2503)-C(2))-methyltransferase [gamma proteobacterium symbiont of Ctena orbiculata]PVV12722.1 MAG: 23S rRNA (adenine(2503)-C(2))-methyltransferase [gamma proteobacterium symbiont of Ctena orbiculata]PVV23105.1 MAG: 23S rRNA (adenine(2503)-C(2))-methyltransferase [gamma proteobacterium symbiont of Ctena orbiculata]